MFTDGQQDAISTVHSNMAEVQRLLLQGAVSGRFHSDTVRKMEFLLEDAARKVHRVVA